MKPQKAVTISRAWTSITVRRWNNCGGTYFCILEVTRVWKTKTVSDTFGEVIFTLIHHWVREEYTFSSAFFTGIILMSSSVTTVCYEFIQSSSKHLQLDSFALLI